MSIETKWGPVIEGPFPSGKPEWLDDDDMVLPSWGNAKLDDGKSTRARYVSYWPGITRLRLRADHPYYAAATSTTAAATKPASDYQMRYDAVHLSGGDMTLARAILAFLKGE